MTVVILSSSSYPIIIIISIKYISNNDDEFYCACVIFYIRTFRLCVWEDLPKMPLCTQDVRYGSGCLSCSTRDYRVVETWQWPWLSLKASQNSVRTSIFFSFQLKISHLSVNSILSFLPALFHLCLAINIKPQSKLKQQVWNVTSFSDFLSS